MAGRTLEELALQVALEHVLHCESLRYLPTGVQLRMWEEVSVMVPITAALLRKFDLHLLAANKTLGGARGLHRDALELLGQYEKEEQQRAGTAHVGLRSLRVSAGLLAPFRQLRSLSLHVFIKPNDLRCLRGMPQLRRLDLSRSSLCDQGMTHLGTLRMWEEVSVMVPITAALLRKFDLHLLAANKTLGGARGLHRDALELLGQYEKEEQQRAGTAHVGLRSLRVSAIHPRPQGMQGLLAPFHQLRSLSLHVFIKPNDLRCLRNE
ncbi:uncharacterized protein ACA1_387490 [Acanthamoeba castellanii str. Neff]|uniref:Uncharacterized protein n=1 Tax=Acanthamoeba castellanii (strain ATCC 30010 / Neff) TaxID=1257118 RepID=L8GDD3_ACACF|nr:uncharacterized protein ACA1_387490 [Acanthamoeba castellanii str. Neff]ELR11140.1 hypothetical protein ACA1_387490 [Acanthamoeba castellanii str. Neff]